MTKPFLDPDRLLPLAEPARSLARDLYERVRDLPLVCPHGHTDPAWFAQDEPFNDAAALLLWPDHYLLRMLQSRGVPYEALGIAPARDRGIPVASPREGWRTFCAHYHLFRGTPSRLWLDHALHEVLGLEERLSAETADRSYDAINERLAEPAFRPRALYERFGIEVIATTDAATDTLDHHRAIRDSGWGGRVIPTFRPDAVTDPEHDAFQASMAELRRLTGADVSRWGDYLEALRQRRAVFADLGATATDHGPPSPATADLDPDTCQKLLAGALAGALTRADAARFRAQMLTEMAGMSAQDGLVMQIHAGSWRNHSGAILDAFGRDKGFDMPLPVDWTGGLHALLERHGFAERLRIILFTLDETTLAREIAPLAGAYPSLLIGPAWWYFDAPEGMRRHRRLVTETAGFYNHAGFNDDTRALLSLPARHDMSRRVECGMLAEMVAEGVLQRDEAEPLAEELAVGLARRAYNLPDVSTD
ncbi:MAG: glucuronate isomerase [Salinarimonas sp.]